MRIPFVPILMATGMQGIGIYVHKLIENNSEAGTIQRYAFVALPCFVGMVTPLAIELVKLIDPPEVEI